MPTTNGERKVYARNWLEARLAFTVSEILANLFGGKKGRDDDIATQYSSITLKLVAYLNKEIEKLKRKHLENEGIVLPVPMRLLVSQADSYKKQYPHQSVVGIIRTQRIRDTIRTLIYLVGFFLLSIVVNLFYPINVNFISLVLAVTTCLLLVGILTFQYRVTKRMYGNNEREAREIIDFIIRESKHIDFKDGGKLKKILSDDDLEELRQFGGLPAPGSAG